MPDGESPQDCRNLFLVALRQAGDRANGATLYTTLEPCSHVGRTPPCTESVIEAGRVFIDAIRTIEPGEELTYDYQIQRAADDPPDIDQVFACRCGRERCRGTMLWPPRPPPPRSRERRARGR